MPDVEMPDGTVIENVPEGTTQQELMRRIEAGRQQGVIGGGQTPGQMGEQLVSQFGQQQPPSVQNARRPLTRDDATAARAFTQGAADRFLGNMERIPDVAANLGARAVNQAAAPFQAMANPQDTLRRASGQNVPRQDPMIETPPLNDQFLPVRPDLMGALQGTGETLAAMRTGDFSHLSRDPGEVQRQITDQIREENPSAFWLGQASGDVLTLVAGRSPIASSRARGELASRRTVERAGRQAPRDSVAVSPTVSKALQEATRRATGVRTLLNRTGRSVETGLEGATLSILNGEADPVESFGYAAGTQAAGSLSLSLMSGLTSGGVGKAALKLGASAAAAGSLVQLAKTSTPGGRDFILESLESGFDKVALGLATGVLSGAAGMGRVTNRFPVRAMPDLADAITAIPRGATISVINEALEDPAVDAVVSQTGNDPEFWGNTARRRLERAMFSEDISISETINDLMDNREFREKFNEIQGQ